MTASKSLTSAAASLALLSMSALIGCNAGGDKSTSQGTQMTVQQAVAALSGEWKLADLNGSPIGPMSGLGGRSPGFTIAPDGGFSGFAGVNRMASKLDLTRLASGEFALAPTAMTRMAGPPELMKLEDDFTAALNNARKFSIKDGALTLLGENGTSLARFVR